MMIKNLDLQLNPAGFIKIGIKSQKIKSKKGVEFAPPKKLDHFRLTLTDRDSEGNYIVDHVLQDKLKEDKSLLNANGDLVKLPIRLLYNDIESNFPSQLVSYVSGRLSCRGDNEISRKSVSNFEKDMPCPCDRIKSGYSGKDICKMSGKLVCVVDQGGLFGQAHQFRTTSENSVKGIIGGLTLIADKARNRLAGLPLYLTLNARNTTTPSGINTTIYLVGICYRGEMSDLRTKVMKMLSEEKQYSIDMDGYTKKLQKLIPHEIDLEAGSQEEQDFIAEFYPNAVDKNAIPPQTQWSSDTVAPTTVIKNENTSDTIDVKKNVEADVEENVEESVEEDVNTNAKTLTSTPTFPTPVGAYLDLYNRLLAEVDYVKATALVNRLKMNDIKYWLEVNHPNVRFDNVKGKVDLVKLCGRVLEEKFPALPLENSEENASIDATDVNTTVKTEATQKVDTEIVQDTESQPVSPEKYPFVAELMTIDRHIEVANAMTAFFKPIPINRTLPIPELLSHARILLDAEPVSYCSVCGEKQFRVMSGVTCQNGHGDADPVFKDENEVVENKSSVTHEVTKSESAMTKEGLTKEPDVAKAPLYPSEHDSSSQITKEQLRKLVRLKTLLESQGLLRPDKWFDHVGYFKDAEGNPVKKAPLLTTEQGDTFIKMLTENIDNDSSGEKIPF